MPDMYPTFERDGRGSYGMGNVQTICTMEEQEGGFEEEERALGVLDGGATKEDNATYE